MQENQYFFRQAKTGFNGLNRTHNPEVAGSSPVSATTKKPCSFNGSRVFPFL